jgi:hypothetical protein
VPQLWSSFPTTVHSSPPLSSLPLTSPPSIFSWSSPNPVIPSFPLSPSLEQSLFAPPLLGLGYPPLAQTTSDWPPLEQAMIMAHPYPFEEQCYFQDHNFTADEGFISTNLRPTNSSEWVNVFGGETKNAAQIQHSRPRKGAN